MILRQPRSTRTYTLFPYPTLFRSLALPWGVVNHFGLNVLVSLLSSGEPAVRGAVMGLYSAVTYVAHFIAGAGLGLVYAGMGFTSVAVVAALVLAIAAAMAMSRTARRE